MIKLPEEIRNLRERVRYINLQSEIIRETLSIKKEDLEFIYYDNLFNRMFHTENFKIILKKVGNLYCFQIYESSFKNTKHIMFNNYVYLFLTDRQNEKLKKELKKEYATSFNLGKIKNI